jgi:hypothetical protein
VLYVINPDGTGLHQVLPRVGIECPNWSPDGSLIATCGSPDGAASRTINPGTGTYREVFASDPTLNLACPVWPPEVAACLRPVRRARRSEPGGHVHDPLIRWRRPPADHHEPRRGGRSGGLLARRHTDRLHPHRPAPSPVMSSLTRRSPSDPGRRDQGPDRRLVRGILACLGAASRNRRVVHYRHWGQHQVQRGKSSCRHGAKTVASTVPLARIRI